MEKNWNQQYPDTHKDDKVRAPSADAESTNPTGHAPVKKQRNRDRGTATSSKGSNMSEPHEERDAHDSISTEAYIDSNSKSKLTEIPPYIKK